MEKEENGGTAAHISDFGRNRRIKKTKKYQGEGTTILSPPLCSVSSSSAVGVGCVRRAKARPFISEEETNARTQATPETVL